MGGRAGDWPCPNTNCVNSVKMVFAKYSSCPKCGSPPEGMLNHMMSRGASDRPGDWACPNPGCVNSVKMVFGKNSSCPKCGTPKPASGGGYHYPLSRPTSPVTMTSAVSMPYKPAPQHSNYGSPGAGGEETEREADWQCPKEDCINHTKLVFGKHSACPSCGTSKNAEKPGDWQCPNPQCANHRNLVFAKRAACNKCGTPRPEKGMIRSLMPMPMPMMPMVNYGAPQRMSMLGGGRGNSGDWQCPNLECLNHTKFVFAKNDQCPKCGSPKPPPISGPNDWQCPNEGCMNHHKYVFGKHETCPKCGEAKPENGSRARSRSPYG